MAASARLRRKHYLAGVLNARTGALTTVSGPSKRSALFCELVDKFVNDNPKARRIHLDAERAPERSS